MKTTTFAAFGTIIAVGFVLAGCSSATPTSPGAAPNSPGGAASAPSAHAAGKHIDICATVPLAKVAALTGKPYVSTKDTVDQKAAGLEGSACGYNGTQDSLTGLAIKVFYGTPKPAWAFLTSENSSLGSPLTTSVPGIGDKALSDGQDDLAVQYGDDVVYVVDVAEPPETPVVPLAQLKQLAALVHTAMQ